MGGIIHSLSIEWQGVVTSLIGFLIFVWIMHRLVSKPVFDLLDQRQAEIKETYDQLDRDREAMQRTREEYEQRLRNIEAEARERIQAAVKEAQDLRDNLVADAQKQAESIIERGRNESERERQKAFLEMRQQVVALAVAAAGKVVGETLDASRHTRLVDEFITQVGAGSVTELGRGVHGNRIGESGAATGNGTSGGPAAP